MFNNDFPIYSLMILLSLIANVVVVFIIHKKFSFTKDQIIGALVYENIGIIVGAKVLTYIHHYQQYGTFDFLSLGLSSYGGVIGAIICLIIFGFQFKKPIKDMLFTFMPSIPLMYAIGKIGCFIAGCCHGIEYNGWGNVVYNYSLVAPEHTHLFPVQIVESIFFILIFVYMINRIMKNKFNWSTLGISFILCGASKFALDFLRISHTDIIISLNQIISLVFILIGVVIFIKNKNHKVGDNK